MGEIVIAQPDNEGKEILNNSMLHLLRKKLTKQGNNYLDGTIQES